jgi:Transglycosylase SLT domain
MGGSPTLVVKNIKHKIYKEAEKLLFYLRHLTGIKIALSHIVIEVNMRNILTLMMILSGTHSGFAAWCDVYVKDAEKRYGIPEHLLKAIAWSESGRHITNMGMVAWPWTINVNGKGYIFETKEKAIQAVLKFQRRGQKSIDVGCMQVNLKHHPRAFKNIQEAFDPKKNVEYAAKFMTSLKNSHQSWYAAVARYHSATPSLHDIYRRKVLKNWEKAKLQPGKIASLPTAQSIQYMQQELGDNFTAMNVPYQPLPNQPLPKVGPPVIQQFNAARNFPVVIQQPNQKIIVNNAHKGKFIPIHKTLPVKHSAPIKKSKETEHVHTLSNQNSQGSVVQITNKRFYPITGDTVTMNSGKRYIPIN